MSAASFFVSELSSRAFGFREEEFCFLDLLRDDLDAQLDFVLFHFCVEDEFFGFLPGLLDFLDGFTFGVL